MPQRTDTFDLARLGLSAGEGRHLDLHLSIPPFSFGGERYEVVSEPVPVALDVSRTTGNGYALRLRFSAELEGPCMRCLGPQCGANLNEDPEHEHEREPSARWAKLSELRFD